MIVYPLTDIIGNNIGKIVLEDDAIPNLIMDDEQFKLGGAFYPLTRNFMNFILIPVMSKETNG